MDSVIFTAALRLLSRREHSQRELQRKLSRKGFIQSDIQATLDQLATENLQSDLRFTEAYVRYRAQAGFGPLRIIAELQERGVSRELIDQAVDLHSSTWEDRKIQALEKKFSAIDRESSDPRKRQQQYRFLLYRGFVA